MTLEDFFTLTEMKDGLTALSRVQELVSVMQKEKDCAVKNAGDATRQWAAVAGTIAATENKDCLDHFIQLDGLWFINKWLKDAQNFATDANDSFFEEAMTTMLRAVEKLNLDSEKLISSDIQVTVSNLLDHNSSRVQDRARVLFDSWKDAESHDMELVRDKNVSDKIIREEGRSSAMTEASNDNDHASGHVGNEKSLLRTSDNLLLETVASVQIQSSDNELSSVSLDGEDIKEKSTNHLASVSPCAQEVTPINEGLPLCPVGETASVGPCNFPVPKQGSFEGQPDTLLLSDLSKKEKQEQSFDGPPEKLEAPEITLVSTKAEPGPVSMGASEAKAMESGKEPALDYDNVESKEDGSCHKITASGSNRQLFKAAVNDNDCCSKTLQDSSVSGSILGKTEVLEMSISETEYVRAVKDSKSHVCDEVKDTSNVSDSSKRGTGSRSPNIMKKKSSDIDLEYGIDDALEVARQVAQEVEREVCSSLLGKISEGGIRRLSSPDSIKEEDEMTCVSHKEVSSQQSLSAEACSDDEGSISNSIEAGPECKPDMESSLVTEAAQDPGRSPQTLCAFDLNEVGSDDMNVSVNAMSMPMPVVSASKPASTPGLPVAPVQFEGTLGWKGSAATSAFRPASPRKNSDSERNSVGGNSDISKQRQNCLDIDLNVAEGEDGLVKQIADSSDQPSGQSSGELSSKRSSRFELDLNSVGDDGDAQPSDQRKEGQLFLGRNGYWSPSPASSSSSMQPSVRNIDLNDRPCLQNDLADQEPSKCFPVMDAFRHSKSDAPVISILGAKVEVDKREYVTQTLSLPNGKAIEPAMDLTMSRTGGILGMGPTVSYNSTVFGYNGLTSASPLPFSSALYGSGGTIPYMVDSRGVPVVPQVGGSSSAVLSSYSQPPFIMNMAGTQLSLNGVGSSRPSFDLNSGLMVDGGTRDTLAASQIFFASQGRAMEEHIRTIPQPSSSGVGGKRKEPDSGWESYPFGYKHPHLPWK